MSGISGSYDGEGPNIVPVNIQTGMQPQPIPPDVGLTGPNPNLTGGTRISYFRMDRRGRLRVSNESVRSSVAINVAAADQALTVCSRWLYVGVTGNLVCRLQDDAADQTFSNLAVGWHQLAIAVVRKTGTTIASSVLGF
jgi:hypothetical protein